MEYLNKIELCGVVGRVESRPISTDGMYVRFALVTESTSKDSKGNLLIETTWFNCISKETIDIQKGDKVHLVGRVKMQRFLDSTNTERTTWEVICQTIEKV